MATPGIAMPRLNVVLGGNGSGKTTWAREHRDTLPKHFYDADSIANSLGDWNDEAYLFEARDIIDQRVEARLAKQEDFGFESTYSGQSRPAIVEKAKKSGYEVTCIFIGTENPDINVERVRARAEAGTGHAVPENSIRYRWKASQQNLVKTFHFMNHMKIIDNSEEKPITVLETRNGRIIHRTSLMPEWANNMVSQLDIQPEHTPTPVPERPPARSPGRTTGGTPAARGKSQRSEST